MPMKDFPTSASSKLILETDGQRHETDLYSAEGKELLCSLYVKQAVFFRWMYEPQWMGRPVIQFPHDILMMQELIWNVKPDIIVECGVAHGGSAIFYASLCELMGHGKVIGVDVEIRPHNREAIENHAMSRRIELIEGSSIDPATIAEVKRRCEGAQSVLICLDSNHTYKHVLAELEAYAPIVTPGSYLVAMDGAQAYVSDVPGGKPEWKEDHPLKAIHEFLAVHPEYEGDPQYTRLLVTSSPEGFLKKKLEQRQ